MDDRYPIGIFEYEGQISDEDLHSWISEIEHYPAKLEKAVSALSKEQLDTAYRKGGWTIRQVVHHVADSHMNAYIRTKLALTEQKPIIKPYEEALWAELADYSMPINVSIHLLTNIHARWVHLLRFLLLTEELERELQHPDSGIQTVKFLIGNYAWHGRHHLAHITKLCENKGWVTEKTF
ncbi:YfiT family bacillithiol transferase [Niallia sp.]|uniref:YfiT family bacillithiol transferase n=1 Tax=Niallia sp. TaxID=2837523 RepID=UPI0028A19321|nr:putative metal-dependent hydrolase [Niallia sp.]